MKKLLFSVTVLLVGNAHASEVRIGHSGTWNDPARGGEGLTLEFIDSDHAALAWYTFDDVGNPRWLYAVGDVVTEDGEERLNFPDIYESTGGSFTSPDAVAVSERVGTASLAFSDCNTGAFSFDAYGQSMTIPVQRLIRVMGLNCESVHGSAIDLTHAHAGLSGTWADPLRSGQGFQLQWLSDGAALLGWYTFDSAGNQHWLTGLGRLAGGTEDGEAEIQFDAVYSVSGPKFGEAFDPADAILNAWGSVTLHLTCSGGTASFASIRPEFGSDTRAIFPFTRAIPGGCPWVRPTLSDLYDIQYMELPIAPDEDAIPDTVHALALADDGSAVALKYLVGNSFSQVLRLRPGAASWDVIAPSGHGNEVLLSPDGVRIISSELTGPISSAPITVWTEATGWSRLASDLGLDREVAYGLSQNGINIVGSGYRLGFSNSLAWSRLGSGSQVELPGDPSLVKQVPQAISNDGKTVVGIGVELVQGQPREIAIRWLNSGLPEKLRDGEHELGRALKCSAECEVIAGAGWADRVIGDPRSTQAWILRGATPVRYLGAPEGAAPSGISSVADMSSDGSVVVGSFIAMDGMRAGYGEGWIWTEQTGSVSLAQVLSRVDGVAPWSDRMVSAASSDGRTLLISGWYTAPNRFTEYRAAIVRLVDRAASSLDKSAITEMSDDAE